MWCKNAGTHFFHFVTMYAFDRRVTPESDYVRVVEDRTIISAKYGKTVESKYLAKTDPCSSRTVSLGQLSFLLTQYRALHHILSQVGPYVLTRSCSHNPGCWKVLDLGRDNA